MIKIFIFTVFFYIHNAKNIKIMSRIRGVIQIYKERLFMKGLCDRKLNMKKLL